MRISTSRHRSLRVLCGGLAAALVAFSSPAAAQNIKASVSGVVLDAGKAAVADAPVNVFDLDRGLERETRTGASGRFEVAGLEPGRYRVGTAVEGFNRYLSAPFSLGVGGRRHFDIRLELGEISTVIEVRGDVPTILQIDDVKTSRSFDREEMNGLPNQAGGTGRNFYTQALTTPGVAFSDLAHRPFAVSGQRPRNNNYMVDSVEANDVNSGFIAGRGRTEQIISQEAVQGMEILTHNFKAEYGRNSGSIVSVVSRSGSDDFHGSAFLYHNNTALRTRNFFEAEKASTRDNLGGFTLGGPIRRNRAFFFSNFETFKTRGDRVSNFRTLTPDERARAVPSVRALADLYPESPTGDRVFASGIPSPSDQYTYLLRGDFALTSKQNLMVRNNFTTNTSDLKNIAGFVGHHVETERTTQSYAVHHSYAATPSTLNELRAGFMRFTQFDEFLDPLLLGDPAINGEVGFVVVPGLSPAGAISFMGAQRALNVFSLSDDFSWVRNRHSFKFGVSARRNHVNGGAIDNTFGGTLFFPSINEFLAGRPLSYNRNVGNPLLGLRRTEMFGYVQDDWRLTSSLTLNLGLRYEFYSSPTEQHDRIQEQFRFPSDRTNFAPRVGLAWNAVDKTVVRAGWGIFYNALEMDFIGLTRFNPPTIVNVAAFRPQLPNLMAQARAGTPSGLVVPSGSARTPYAQHLNFSVERELWNPGSTVTAAYVGTLGTALPRTRRPNGGDSLAQNLRPDPATGVVNRLETSSSSSYHSLQANYNQRFSDLTLRVAYTWSKFIDDVSEFATGNTRLERGILPLDETNLLADRGFSDFHIGSVFTSAWLYRVPWMRDRRILGGWTLSGISVMQSGRPYTLFSGTNNLMGTDNNRIFGVPGTLQRNPSAAQAVALTSGLASALAIEPSPGQLGTLARNSERTDSLMNWNFGAHKDFALTENVRAQVRAELFNAFNVTNFNAVENVLSVQRNAAGTPTGFNPNFGRYVSAFSPRTLQLALRLTF